MKFEITSEQKNNILFFLRNGKFEVKSMEMDVFKLLEHQLASLKPIEEKKEDNQGKKTK